MEPFSFEKLPEVIRILFEKVEHIEELIRDLQPQPPNENELLTIQEAAEFLKVTVPALYTKVSRHEIPVSKPGKRLYFNKTELKKLSKLLDNSIEATIRTSAVGKRNFLFHGAHEGGCWAAMFYSFFGTCKLHKINPLEWLTDILTRMPEYPKDKLTELLPQNWSPPAIA